MLKTPFACDHENHNKFWTFDNSVTVVNVITQILIRFTDIYFVLSRDFKKITEVSSEKCK